MSVKLLTEHHLESLSSKGGITGSSESTLVKMPLWMEIRSHGSYGLQVSYDVAQLYRPNQVCLFFSSILHTCNVQNSPCVSYFCLIIRHCRIPLGIGFIKLLQAVWQSHYVVTLCLLELSADELCTHFYPRSDSTKCRA